MGFALGFTAGTGISNELSLLTSGFRTMAFFAGSGSSTGDVAPLRAVRALVILETVGTASCDLGRVEALAVVGFPDMILLSD